MTSFLVITSTEALSSFTTPYYNTITTTSRNCNSFLGNNNKALFDYDCYYSDTRHHGSSSRSFLVMRKQKASDRRTRRRQRGELLEDISSITTTLTSNPMQKSFWKYKNLLGNHRVVTTSSTTSTSASSTITTTGGGGRGRSRKRSTLYTILGHYQNHFLQQLTAEYQAEEDEVIGRIQASIDDPIGLEQAGYALFDMYVERRGNLYSEEIYRLTKATDATTVYSRSTRNDDNDEEMNDNDKKNNHSNKIRYLPSNHKFSNNDVIVLTQQSNGSGDFFTNVPIAENAITLEARVMNMGPTYLDIAVSAGMFESTFGLPPNDISGNGNRKLRIRVDKFISNITYQRMVIALSQLTALPTNNNNNNKNNDNNTNNKKVVIMAKTNNEPNKDGKNQVIPDINMDDVIKDVILYTYAITNPNSPLHGDSTICDLDTMSYKLSRPPMANSNKLTNQVIKYLIKNPTGIFPEFNTPQRASIEAALTRRMTLIQGPPGSGKTTVAAAIGFGFVHQCRSISEHTKVLACAFSNVGADNLAEALLKLGLKVVRVGKPSAVSESLWPYTLEAAIDNDPTAQKALQHAAKATAQLARNKKKGNSSTSKEQKPSLSERSLKEAATAAVVASIEASNIAATKALREADVIVSTSTGAADPRLLAACGIVTGTDDPSARANNESKMKGLDRVNAPDGMPPLSLPFVMIDEACQSVEPASLIPIVSSNSCRSLVMLGDPCQLPPTIRSRQASSLSVSLMERLAETLPHSSIIPSADPTIKDSSYLDALPVKQAVSLVRSRSSESIQRSYRKVYSGAMLLSVQYRMHPSIAALPSAMFYNGLLSTPDFMRQVRTFPSVLNKLMPCGNEDFCVRVIDVGGKDNERQGNPSKYTRTVYSNKAASTSSILEDKTTYWNEAEAERVVLLVKDILSGRPDNSIKSIGVITPYNGQVQLIKAMVASDETLREMLVQNPITIEVKSVDGYQGRERDVIIFSAVRSNRNDRIGFLHDWRRLNVAMTRAKSALVIVGDIDTLATANKHWDGLRKWAMGTRCIIDDSECPEDEVSL